MGAPSSPAAVPAPQSRLPLHQRLLSDERLARLVEDGSERAFAVIYERYHQPLYRYCRSHVRDGDDAYDALQSTLANALAALQRGQRDAPLRPWLFRIAHNETVSLIRRRERRPGSFDAPERLVPSAEARADERARLALLVSDLGELPERQRAVLLMSELSGLSRKDIASALGLSVHTVAHAILAARRSLGEFEEGRAMLCEQVQRSISRSDGRLPLRARAHVRDCAACAAFAAAIPDRRARLHALAPPLAPVPAAALLAVLRGASSTHGAGAGGAMAAGLSGKAAGAALTAKALASIAVVAVASVSATGVASKLAGSGRHSAKAAVPAPASTAERHPRRALRTAAARTATARTHAPRAHRDAAPAQAALEVSPTAPTASSAAAWTSSTPHGSPGPGGAAGEKRAEIASTAQRPSDTQVPVGTETPHEAETPDGAVAPDGAGSPQDAGAPGRRVGSLHDGGVAARTGNPHVLGTHGKPPTGSSNGRGSGETDAPGGAHASDAGVREEREREPPDASPGRAHIEGSHERPGEPTALEATADPAYDLPTEASNGAPPRSEPQIPAGRKQAPAEDEEAVGHVCGRKDTGTAAPSPQGSEAPEASETPAPSDAATARGYGAT